MRLVARQGLVELDLLAVWVCVMVGVWIAVAVQGGLSVVGRVRSFFGIGSADFIPLHQFVF